MDTRPEIEFGICSIPHSTSTPSTPRSLPTSADTSDIPLSTLLSSPETVPASDEVIVVCKKGNDSQVAAAALRKRLGETSRVRDVRGGLIAWARDVDPEFPMY